MSEEKKKLVGIYLPIELLKQLKVFASNNLTSVSEIAEKAIRDFLERNK